MPRYRRNDVAGGIYFFTLVTHARQPILTTRLGRDCLRTSLGEIRDHSPFRVFAICLLPDHLHMICMLPPNDADYSTRIKRIKHQFTQLWLASGGSEGIVSAAKKNAGRRGIWQPRFWEHTVRDEDDLSRCADYIHWNPRKHGLVRCVKDWPYSSFHRFVAAGHYPADWGGVEPRSLIGMKRNWGETP